MSVEKPEMKMEINVKLYKSLCVSCGVQFGNDSKLGDGHVFHRCQLKSNYQNDSDIIFVNTDLKAYREVIDYNFNCVLCDFRSCDYVSFSAHANKTHYRDHVYICTLCKYETKSRGNFCSHLMIHSNDKPFKCKVCTYRCRTKYGLKTHIRTHTGEKPYECDMCNFRCTTLPGLKVHKRTHTGEKPYKCDMCNYRTTQPGHLKEHTRIHTGENVSIVRFVKLNLHLQ